MYFPLQSNPLPAADVCMPTACAIKQIRLNHCNTGIVSSNPVQHIFCVGGNFTTGCNPFSYPSKDCYQTSNRYFELILQVKAFRYRKRSEEFYLLTYGLNLERKGITYLQNAKLSGSSVETHYLLQQQGFGVHRKRQTRKRMSNPVTKQLCN
jgi:hypothetical protein